ncbi:hypothetical protein BJ875DRAFT_483093 [Amylocarpus encephaloides]|uniref:DUF1754-domain-containing protein n=1 Tax=Amylocarpus encephaloides TaxID=45428 RepID=A0A9P7YL84_9HELO|nr:hypothetical protein BJ875DRAFT_483093 [Amylocarpus encephaloides]
MPPDEYAPVVRGGLKLKGAGVAKKKKKAKPPQPEGGSQKNEALLAAAVVGGGGEPNDAALATKRKPTTPRADAGHGDEGLDLGELEQRDSSGKTPTERAYEENRRKRLQARIEREGPKTHKQRVEDLNKYLSTLSEHHDMPRIGPG